MKKRSLFFTMAAVALLASCSKSEIGTNPANVEGEIMLKSSVAKINPGTRAAFGEVDAIPDLATTPLVAYIIGSTDADFSTVYSEGTMTFNGTTEVAYNKPMFNSTEFKYPTQGTEVYLTGLYPAEGWTLSAPSAEITLTGKEDVMYAEIVTDANDGSYNYQTLAFEHQLTWIQIKLTGDEAASVDKSITVTGITLTQVEEADVATTVTVDLENRTVDFSGASTLTVWDLDDVAYASVAAVTEYDSDMDTPALADLDVDAYVLAPASTTTDDGSVYNYTFEVAYEEDGVASTQTVRIALVDGGGTDLTSKYVSLHLHFIGNQIKAMATVGEWEEGPSHTEEI